MNHRIKTAVLLSLGIAATLVPTSVRAQTVPAPASTAPKSAPATSPAEARVTLDLRDAPIRQALDQLFRQVKSDYSLDNAVQGYLTLKITDQPFENALRLVLRSSSVPLSYTVDSGVYLIKPRRAATPGGIVPPEVLGGGPASSRGPSSEQMLIADQDGNRLLAVTGQSTDVITLTYLDPADIAGLFRILQIPSFSRQGGGGGNSRAGAPVGLPGGIAGGPVGINGGVGNGIGATPTPRLGF
ncbi:MAG: hypothetical protein H7Z41_12475 [Cytophagales bacterium]|nr:hypothetical protein [Armatimonadota bacterium]